MSALLSLMVVQKTERLMLTSILDNLPAMFTVEIILICLLIALIYSIVKDFMEGGPDGKN